MTVKINTSLKNNSFFSAGNGKSLSCDREDVPTDSRNTAYRAAEYFMEAAGVSGTVCIDIEKHIPSGAGMGGGSADAAAVLRALNMAYGEPLTEDSLLEIAARVGADVPFCLVGGTRLCRGIGEQMSDFPAPEGVFLVVKPEFSCPTGEAYRKYDGSPLPVHGGLEGFRAAVPGGYAPEMYNVFQRLYSDGRIEDICRRLREAGAKGAILTGSGSACFGVFGSREDAESASAQFADCFTAVCGAAEQGILISEKEVL